MWVPGIKLGTEPVKVGPGIGSRTEDYTQPLIRVSGRLLLGRASGTLHRLVPSLGIGYCGAGYRATLVRVWSSFFLSHLACFASRTLCLLRRECVGCVICVSVYVLSARVSVCVTVSVCVCVRDAVSKFARV